jgi:ElaB/YqjD/DUF883 family membrane-anchored ribosome-binding protein
VCGRKQINLMKLEDTLEQVSQQGKDLYGRALEKTREGAGAADRILHRNTYNVLAAGILAGFVTGFLVSRGCRCRAS